MQYRQGDIVQTAAELRAHHSNDVITKGSFGKVISYAPKAVFGLRVMWYDIETGRPADIEVLASEVELASPYFFDVPPNTVLEIVVMLHTRGVQTHLQVCNEIAALGRAPIDKVTYSRLLAYVDPARTMNASWLPLGTSPALKQYLKHSWVDINFNYDMLTEDERAILSKSDFDALVVWASK